MSRVSSAEIEAIMRRVVAEENYTIIRTLLQVKLCPADYDHMSFL